MVKRQNAMMPVQGGIRKRRATAPKIDGTIIDYNSQQSNFPTVTAGGYTGEIRNYIPGLIAPLINGIGPEIVSSYSTAKFLPGTKSRYEPSVSFTTTGRVFVGFTDNPEVAISIGVLFGTALGSGLNADWAAYLTAIKGLGNMVSFPVWQETDVQFPTRLRRKMFDTNFTASPTDVNVYDRSMQQTMFIGVEGLNITANPGGFWFHDKLVVEGIHSRLT